MSSQLDRVIRERNAIDESLRQADLEHNRQRAERLLHSLVPELPAVTQEAIRRGEMLVEAHRELYSGGLEGQTNRLQFSIPIPVPVPPLGEWTGAHAIAEVQNRLLRTHGIPTWDEATTERTEGPSNEEMIRKNQERKEALKPKPTFNKAAFIHTLSPSKELWAIIEPMTEKQDILKAVFEYNNRLVVTPIDSKPRRGALKFIEQHNKEIEAQYTRRLEVFYKRVNEFCEDDSEDFFNWLDNEGTIARAQPMDMVVFGHPLFEVVGLAKSRRGQLDTKMRIITRDDVWFTFEGNKMNFGKFTFTLNLRTGSVAFNRRKDNFPIHAGPYLNGTSVCMGEQTYTFQNKVRVGKVFDAMTELYTVMTRFNKESHPYRAIDRFFDDAKNRRLLRIDRTYAELLPIGTIQQTKTESNDLPF